MPCSWKIRAVYASLGLPPRVLLEQRSTERRSDVRHERSQHADDQHALDEAGADCVPVQPVSYLVCPRVGYGRFNRSFSPRRTIDARVMNLGLVGVVEHRR